MTSSTSGNSRGRSYPDISATGMPGATSAIPSPVSKAQEGERECPLPLARSRSPDSATEPEMASVARLPKIGRAGFRDTQPLRGMARTRRDQPRSGWAACLLRPMGHESPAREVDAASPTRALPPTSPHDPRARRRACLRNRGTSGYRRVGRNASSSGASAARRVDRRPPAPMRDDAPRRRSWIYGWKTGGQSEP